MRMTKKLFGVIFIIVSAGLLILLDVFDLHEKYYGFALIPLLMAYFVGQYSERRFKN